MKAGIILSKLKDSSSNDINLLTPLLDKKSKNLMKVIDVANMKYGRHTISITHAGTKKDWKMRRAFF